LDLLRGLGFSPAVVPARLHERNHPGESPREMVLRLATAKANLVARDLLAHSACYVVLAADTAVVIDGRVLGKPRDTAEAAEMLRLLRGRTHEVLTGVCLVRTDDGRSVAEVETTRVRFGNYDEDVIRTYVETGEPMDKAGAYAIQSGGSRLAEAVDGSWSNVVGLPLERLPDWLGRIDVDLDDLGARTKASDQALDSTNFS
jgi:septum formation protein